MKPRPFEVGDRVIVKQNAYQGWGAGKTGQIVRVEPNEVTPTRFFIHFDDGAGDEILGNEPLKKLQFYSDELDFDPFMQCCYEALQDIGVENNPPQPLDIPLPGGVG